jgi:hypothetical protein
MGMASFAARICERLAVIKLIGHVGLESPEVLPPNWDRRWWQHRPPQFTPHETNQDERKMADGCLAQERPAAAIPKILFPPRHQI